jgi:hypothetical protein
MDKKSVDKLVKAGAKTSVDNKNTQSRQVLVSTGKLRIQVGNPKNGKANN